MLKIGDRAPEFSLRNEDGLHVALKDFNNKTVVLYFYPKDDTPGCTAEACSFRDSYAKFKNMVILGVSMDSTESHKKFKEKHALPFALLSDEKGATCKDYGVLKQKTMFGKKFLGIQRTTFIIGKNGRIKHIFTKVDTENHADEVMENIKDR